MQKKFRFTNANIKALPTNPTTAKATELEVSDSEVIGLKCLSGKREGSKRFLFRYTYQGRKSSIAVGKFPDIDVTSARKLCRKHKLKLAENIDPRAERDGYKGMPTVSEFFNQTYLPLVKTKNVSWKDDVSRFTNHCNGIANVRYDALTASHVQQIQLNMRNPPSGKRVYKPATCNRVLALLKAMGGLAERLLDLPNVANKVTLLAENNARTRFCSVEEVRNILYYARAYQCRAGTAVGKYYALLFLTGCRASELRLRLWTELDIENRILKIPMTKNRTPHIVYLTDLMLDIFAEITPVAGNPYIFAGTKYQSPICEGRNAFKIIKKQANISNPDEVTAHTARHTAPSLLLSHADRTNADLRSIMSFLNHRDISSTIRYGKLNVERQRQTTESLSALIEGKL